MKKLNIKKLMTVVIVVLCLGLAHESYLLYTNIPNGTTVSYNVKYESYTLDAELKKLNLQKDKLIKQKSELKYNADAVEEFKKIDTELYMLELKIVQLIKLLDAGKDI